MSIEKNRSVAENVEKDRSAFLESTKKFFLDGRHFKYADGREQVIPAMWDVSGYLFNDGGSILDQIDSEEGCELLGITREEFYSDDEIIDALSDGILHFMTKATIDSRLLDYLDSLPVKAQRIICPKVVNAIKDLQQLHESDSDSSLHEKYTHAKLSDEYDWSQIIKELENKIS
ncbi:MAG: hypothetical protein KBC35_01390 [Candidatus Pacebacteria bacterium]|nr:hypothetical protein [Candidatus Paceibacterota bacterium]